MDPSRCAATDSPSGPRRNSLLRFMHAKLSSTEKWSAMCTLATVSTSRAMDRSSATFPRRALASKTARNSRVASRSTPPNLTTLPPISGGIALLSAKRNEPAQSNNWAWNFVCTQQVLADLDFEAANPAGDEVIDSRANRCEDSPDQAIDQRKENDRSEPHAQPKRPSIPAHA